MYLIMFLKLNSFRQRYAYQRCSNGWEGADAGGHYACGYSPPHYPVPALHITVEWNHPDGTRWFIWPPDADELTEHELIQEW